MPDTEKNGWIKLYRKIENQPWFTHSDALTLAIYCLIHAAYKDGKIMIGNQQITIKKGQMIIGRKWLAKRLKSSEQRIRTAIIILRDSQFLTSKSTNKYTILTICNYSKYQSCDCVEQPTLQPTNNQQITNDEPLYKNIRKKEVKKEKEIKKRYILSGLPDNIPYKSIIDILNEETESQFKHTSKKTRLLIDARWNEGFREYDFEYVIKIKTDEWKNDPKMSKFLRPETLFSPKFEGYRNQKPTCKQPYLMEWLKEKEKI